ncbi:acyl transferase/acyl hydrolase/lysophospholipase [Apiospora arundinis]|uniref:Patatin-like phospholipase domain-containing protein n=1 Tax=Apiospora arundinis TaxID=335852 RepID=A0ABR2HQN8_9PEZI
MTEILLPNLGLNSPSSHKIQPKAISASKTICTQSTAVSATESLYKALKTLSSLALPHYDGLSDAEREAQRKLDERKQILMARLQNADTFSQWETAAQELDVLEGNEEWKADTSSGDYQPDLIESRLKDLDTARINCDLRGMLHLVRTALSRDLGGMGNIDLYRHSYCGTKKLIERYVDSTLQTISAVVERSAHPLPGDLETKDLLDAVLFARQSFGRSALLLSGGGTFGMSHIGVLKTLFETKLIPRIISGASAGSIVCSVVCTRTDDEIPQLLKDFPYGDLAVFEEEGNEDGLMDHVRRLLTEGNWSDIRHLTRVMQNLLGDMTFQEAYNRTRRICNICVSPASIYELPRLLNYVTAPNVMIWSAVAASCSVPLVFSAAPLLVKNPLTGEHSPWNPTPQMWIDGSVDNDLPMTRLAEMFNVNHFIVSQVNPHVVPFLAKEDAPYPISGSQDYVSSNDEGDWLYTVTQLAKGEALHRMHILAEIGIFPTLVSKLRSILSQKYSGDINILPAMGLLDLPKILKNPTIDFMHRSCLLGERATWPKMARIRDRCAVELALDRAVHALRARVVFSKSQVDLRRLATGSLVNPFRGSESFHINLNLPAPETVTAKDKLKQRHRRSSGSCVQPIPVSRHLDDPYKVTDDDTDVEERLEIALRKPHGKSRQLKLKRYSKGQAFQTGPLTTPHLSSVNEPNAFDFAQPPSPVKVDQHSPPDSDVLGPTDTLSALKASEVEDSPEPTTTTLDEASTTFSSHGPSHSTELETSDPYTSDADIDSRSDDSNIGVDVAHSPSEPATDSDNPFPQGAAESSSHGSPTPKDNMFSRSRRESSSWNGIFDPVDPGAGLWS